MSYDVEEAHKRSIRHRAEIEASATCGCFSVLGDRSGFPIHAEFLAAMRTRWFGE